MITALLLLLLAPLPAAAAPGSLTVTRRVEDSGARTAPVNLAVAGGYGYTEAVLGQDDQHHRLLGSLLVEGAPLRWLGLGLRLDGRYDRHALRGGASDDGWVGEPRLHVRVDRPLLAALSVGGRATVFLPGATAPSWKPAATSGDLLALVSYGGERLTVSGNAGYRLDRSARSAMDASRYSAPDRLALGASAFDAVLLGTGVSYDLGRWRLFGEWSWDVLVGGGAPAATQSPMRIGGGARTGLGQAIDLELMVEAHPGRRPAIQAGAPLVPVPPRLALIAGLVVPFGGRAAGELAAAPERPAPEAVPARPPGPAATEPLAEVPSLSVTLAAPGSLPAGAAVTLEHPAGERSLEPDGERNDRYTVRGVRPGPATVVVRAPGYNDSRTPVELQPGQPLSVQVALARKLPSGQIRGTVRDLRGRAVAVSVRVVPSDDGGAGPQPRELRSDDGTFELDVTPGRYQVAIEAAGHTPQTRVVLVELNGVTVLNVDLRPRRP